MRTAFIDALTEFADAHERVHLVVGDMGYSVVEGFAERHPGRFLNAGVSEQNMTGMAAGLALAGGATVFTYSLGCFPTLRCLEQVRNDVCYHRADVKIVAVGGGVSYGAQGHTHHAIEDLALMRAMPGMVVAAPADPVEARAVARLAAATPGPWYIRLGKNREPTIHEQDIAHLRVGEALRVRDGSDGTILAIGSVTWEAHEAVRQAAQHGIEVRLLSVPFLKPLDAAAVAAAARETRWVMTVEEHHGHGGLGSAVAEVMAEQGLRTRLVRVHLPERLDEIGSQAHLRRYYGLDARAIGDRIRQLAAQ